MTITAGHFERSATAILATAEPADRTGTQITLDAARKAHADGDHDLAGALLDEAACRAHIIGHAKHRELFAARLAGRRTA